MSQAVWARGGALLLVLVPLIIFGGCDADSDSAAEHNRDDSATAGAGPVLPDEWEAEYEQMSARLDLSPDEATSLKRAFEERHQAVEQWWAAKGQTLVEYETRMQQAARDKDLSAMRRAKQQAQPLRDEFRSLIREQDVRLEQALPADQRQAWDAQRLLIKFEGLCGDSIQLTTDQERQLDDLARQHAATAASDRTRQNRLAQPFLDFERAAENTVLTPEQKNKYAEIKKNNALRSLKW